MSLARARTNKKRILPNLTRRGQSNSRRREAPTQTTPETGPISLPKKTRRSRMLKERNRGKALLGRAHC